MGHFETWSGEADLNDGADLPSISLLLVLVTSVDYRYVISMAVRDRVLFHVSLILLATGPCQETVQQ